MMERQVLEDTPKHYLRIHYYHRIVHGLLMTSFVGLAATGMPLRLNHAGWAINIAHAIGGFGAVLFFHKTFAILLTFCFLLHLGYIFNLAFVERRSGMFWGTTSMIPQPRDLVEMLGHIRWFVGMGPKPRFGRFAYWEKFDYWAVFWGMAVIGSSGYVMWFSSFFGSFLPGWLFNVALLIHADEALLAVWFIFTIHFFNSHVRPGKFILDLVIFTGRVSEEELRKERPAEYARLVKEGKLEALRADAPPLWLQNVGRAIGFSVLATGFLLFGLTIVAFFNHH